MQAPDLGDQESTPVTTSSPGELALQEPPIGSGNVLSVPEIRYCLALKERVEAAKPVVDLTSQDQVDRFNSMVDDYNSRCHDFLYHTGDLEEAQRDVAPYIQHFRAQGRQMVRHGELNEVSASQLVSSASSRQVIRDAQRELNALGYDVGVADGLMGSRTQSAIELFQAQNGFVVTGLVNDFLAERKRVAEKSSAHQRPDRSLAPSATEPAPSATADQSPWGSVGDTSRSEVATGIVHAHAIGNCNPAYPADESRLGHEGTVMLSVRVGTDGGVTAVRIESSNASAALEAAAVETMEQCRFVPASQDGRPVVDQLRVPVSFTLSGAQ